MTNMDPLLLIESCNCLLLHTYQHLVKNSMDLNDETPDMNIFYIISSKLTTYTVRMYIFGIFERENLLQHKPQISNIIIWNTKSSYSLNLVR